MSLFTLRKAPMPSMMTSWVIFLYGSLEWVYFALGFLAYCSKPHPLGLSHQQNDISHITASSVLGVFVATNARLRNSYSWCARKKQNQKLNVDLGKFVMLKGLATQKGGYGTITEFKLHYSYDGDSWYGYPSNSNLTVRILIPLSFGNYYTSVTELCHPKPNILSKLIFSRHVFIYNRLFCGNKSSICLISSPYTRQC